MQRRNEAPKLRAPCAAGVHLCDAKCQRVLDADCGPCAKRSWCAAHRCSTREYPFEHELTTRRCLCKLLVLAYSIRCCDGSQPSFAPGVHLCGASSKVRIASKSMVAAFGSQTYTRLKCDSHLAIVREAAESPSTQTCGPLATPQPVPHVRRLVCAKGRFGACRGAPGQPTAQHEVLPRLRICHHCPATIVYCDLDCCPQ